MKLSQFLTILDPDRLVRAVPIGNSEMPVFEYLNNLAGAAASPGAFSDPDIQLVVEADRIVAVAPVTFAPGDYRAVLAVSLP